LKIVEKYISVVNESLILTNQRALFWERHKTLVLSDLHIGKTAHFRKHGIPIPDDIMHKDLDRLKELILHFHPVQLLIVGDLFHAEANSNMPHFQNWREQFSEIEMLLIKGNHDRLPQQWLTQLGLQTEHELFMDPFLFVHDPSESPGVAFTISGHIHPGVFVKGKGRQRIKLPCFALHKQGLILPAFSQFTGLNSRYARGETTYYAFTGKEFFTF